MLSVDKEKCIGCKICLNVCPVKAVSMNKDKAEIDNDKCIDCSKCIQFCPKDAIYSTTESFSFNSNQMFPAYGFGMRRKQGRGLGRGMGRGLGRGSQDGRGRGRGRGI